MILTIELPDRSQTAAETLRRWDEICNDPNYANFPGRVESNFNGNVVLNPPPSFSHSIRTSRIISELTKRIGGMALPECAVLTADGVKGIDVGWMTEEELRRRGDQTVCDPAPPICIEVLSPSNRASEMRSKRALYFDAGAKECWECDQDGRMHFYLSDTTTAVQQSILCPDFPPVLGATP